MSRRGRAIALGLVLALAGLQVAYWLLAPSTLAVRVENAGNTPLDGLVLVSEGEARQLGDLQPGESVEARLPVRDQAPLALQIPGASKGLRGIELADADARYLRRSGRRLVLAFDGQTFVRYSEPDVTRLARFRQAVAPYWERIVPAP
jgi:hypothetical protein